ncbi:PHP domain-containing protein [Marinicrinis lubricantis]|uniref:PHP domain-containing protein n=1 Tax=Marinicrinis lubricantis TaxID=2086470 RepID=A0ABW1IP90_9BACL
MNIDFHTHGKLSKKTEFSVDYFLEMIEEAKANGLDAIALTEHFNTIRFSDIYDTLDRLFPYNGHVYVADGLKIFPGMEVDIAETGHILMISTRENIRALREKLHDHTDPDHFVPFGVLLDWTEQEDILRIGAHPYRESTPLHHLPDELLNRLDAFDLNGKDLYQYSKKTYRVKVEQLAERFGKPVVAGSDTHQCLQYGSVWNEIEADCHSISDLKASLTSKAYQIHVSICLESKVKGAIMMKKLLKQSLEDGHDRFDEETQQERTG